MGRPKGSKMTEEHKQRIREGRRRGLEQKARAARATQRAELKAAARGASVTSPAVLQLVAEGRRDEMIVEACRMIVFGEGVLKLLNATRKGAKP